MQAVFEAINGVFGFIGPLSDLLWDFPTNFEWYRNIPILGNISLAIIVLLGSGIFFTIKLGFIQVTHFKKGIRLLTEKRSVQTGITPLAAFLLSAAMRVKRQEMLLMLPEPLQLGDQVLFLDVDLRIFRNGSGLYGSGSGTGFQGKEGR